ncbi:MAG: NAD(P)/FAD-dependent oxidoreductase [Bacillota bacterium]
MAYDVVIIGGGVIGTAIARELSRFEVSVVLIEKESDVAMGASRANSGIVHAGYDPLPESTKARLNVQGNRLMEGVCAELNVSFKRTGSLVVGFTPDDLKTLEVLLERGRINGLQGLRILNKDELITKEPNLSPDAEFALYAPQAGIVCPYTLTIALAENAVHNGVEVRCETKATGIHREKGRVSGVMTTRGLVPCRYVINAAGVWSDEVAGWNGSSSFKILPYRGEYCILDKKRGDLVRQVLFPIPGAKTKGILVVPTVSGNILLGPNRSLVEDREDCSTSRAGLSEVLTGARYLVPGIRDKDIIASFAGIRAVSDSGEFIIGPSEIKGFINVGGIQSPGLTAAPAIAKMITGILQEEGLRLKEKPNYIPQRAGAFRFATAGLEERQSHIAGNRAFGEVVCRCETVTAGEIVEAIRGPIGAGTLDAVKRRTRAGMGRCQGGFCSHRVANIVSSELNIPVDEVTKSGPGSQLVHSRE